MLDWAKTADGWALNLDGSDAAAGFSFPRLELHSGPHGWECLFLLANGTSHRPRGVLGSAASAKRTAIEQARSVLGSAYAGVLEDMLGAG